ncbi:MAG: NAD-dependent epimerase/dehydratase family protein [Dehalococcoidia bacterium]|nr:NAD-dependent epimerase/dehydratase family protein [Dehalococcoidia bacterium]
MKRTLISGSTGLIGRSLVRRLEADGHEVVRLVRPETRGGVSGVTWDPARGVLEPSELEGFDAVVHLAGENIADRRWSDEQKRRIRDSRVVGTTLLSTTLATLNSPPSVFACASAGGYYGDRGDEALDDSAGPGTDFIAGATKEWEEACQPAGQPANQRRADGFWGNVEARAPNFQARFGRQAGIWRSILQLDYARGPDGVDRVDVGEQRVVRRGECYVAESCDQCGLHQGTGEVGRKAGDPCGT